MVTGNGAGTSGGVAVLVREELGLREAEDVLQPTHRLVAGKVDLPGKRKLLVTAAYFITAIGITGGNNDLINDIGRAHAEWKGPAVVGGDFNATPQQLAPGAGRDAVGRSSHRTPREARALV